jgi:TP901 family phage tail tape measure protein
MSVDADLIEIRMRLQGGQQVAAESKAAAGGIGEVGTAAEATNAKTATASRGIGASISNMLKSAERMKAVGRAMTLAITVPFIAVSGLAVKSSLDFSNSLEQVHTQAGGTAAEVRYLHGQILDFAASGESTHGPQDLANSIYHIESAGYRGAKAMDVLRKAEALATTGHADMEQTTNALVGAMRSGIKGTGDLGRTVGTLNAIVGAGNMRMNELTGAMGTGLLPRAKVLGISLDQVGAALATMTRQGQPAQISATRFTMAMNMMESPTSKAAGALQAIGINVDQLGILMQKHDLPAALDMLRSHLDAIGNTAKGRALQSQAISAIFGGGRTSGGIQTILAALDQYHSTLHQIQQQEAPATFDKLHKAAQEAPAERLATAWTQVQAAFVKLGDTLIPVVIPALTAVASVVIFLAGGFANLPHPLQLIVFGLAALAAAAGPALVFMGAMATAAEALGISLGVLAVGGGIVTGIILLAAAFALAYEKVQWFHNAVDDVFGWIKQHWPLLLGPILLPFALGVRFIARNFGAIKGIVGSVFSWVIHAAGTITKPLTTPWNTFKHVVMTVIHAIGAAIQWLINKIKGIGGAVGGIASQIWSKVPGHGAIDSITGAGASAVGSVAGEAQSLLGFASGGVQPVSSFAWVGEQGPELAWLPGGTHIFSADESQQLARGKRPLRRPKGAAGTVSPIDLSAVGSGLGTIVVQSILDGRVLAETTVDVAEATQARQ